MKEIQTYRSYCIFPFSLFAGVPASKQGKWSFEKERRAHCWRVRQQ
ncbi:MAG TPA: hypothetical protein VNB90_07760 [Cytophagaceae bacterium]|nr:hypothetical protein [Cytophagaceae bacterium]